ncbi:maleylacetate reductase [Tardiphaga alba]|uniref:Maleylacetate reductase n=1 Tax=Tardiphaga alba TaxID=340268 RepID=A0ABX8A4R3_9BRAD|nr:maleylacetate reductase [Tardiphaga alba]QUS38656.1 maleylacetate reductase [Tardiphaga alba]
MRVLFGAGRLADLSAELDRLGVGRALILTTPHQKIQGDDIASMIGGRAAGVYSGATMHTPVHVTEQAMQQVALLRADGVVAVGGGSTIGLGKAIAFRTDLPQVVVPTSYAGSEMTPILGETVDGLKTTRSDPKILPETVIYDVDLTRSLSVPFAVTSGINAIAHAVEALYARDGNPVISLMAEEGIKLMAGALPRLVAGDDADARDDAVRGAWLCGACLGAVGMSLHHKLCHTLGGTFDLPHAETHTIVLPHALAYNAPAVPAAAARVARALGVNDAAQGLFDLAKGLGAKLALRDIGMPRDGIEKATDIAFKNAYWNPRVLERDAIRDLIARAWDGERPKGEI